MDVKKKEKVGLTTEKLKQYKGLENISEEKAEKIIASIKQFVRILMKVKII